MISITQIGIAMVLIPVSAVGGFAVMTMLMLMAAYTIKSCINRDIGVLIAMALAWSFVIGTILILIGSV